METFRAKIDIERNDKGIMKFRHELKDVSKILEEFRCSTGNHSFKSEKLLFKGVDDYDVYNITAPFKMNDKEIIAGRVEKRDSEYSKVMFFEKTGNSYTLIKGTPSLELQDPSVSIIDNELIVSGVEIFDHPVNKGKLWWKTVFFKGDDIFSLKRFAEGPNGMKDIRLIDLGDQVGVFTRPQNALGELDSGGGRGTIGYVEINTLNELNINSITEAKLLEGLLPREQWLGSNEIHVLKNGLLGVLGHIAKYDDVMDRHYYPAVFAFDRIYGAFSSIKIIAERCMFEDGPCKKPDLKDVVFSGGIIRKRNGKSDLYVGTGDTEAQKIEINDPFLEYEYLK